MPSENIWTSLEIWAFSPRFTWSHTTCTDIKGSSGTGFIGLYRFNVYAHVHRLVIIGFDMQVQPLDTHSAAWPLCSVCAYGVSSICIDVVSSHKLFAHMQWALLALMSWAVISYWHMGYVHCSYRCSEQAYELLQNGIWYHKIAECIARYKWINDLWYNGLLIVFHSRNGMKPTTLTLAWNQPVEILVAAFEICNGLFDWYEL